MIRNAIVTALLVVVAFSRPVLGQDSLAEHRIRSLKGLPSIAIIIRPGTDRDEAKFKEWSDKLEVALTNTVPNLSRSKPDSARAYLELGVVSTNSGAALTLGLYRWVRIVDTGDEVFTTVWQDSRFIFGGSTDLAQVESLDKLVTSFAAGLARANR